MSNIRSNLSYSRRIQHQILWPHNAKLAVNFIINYEEGSEQNVLDGDATSECYLTDIPLMEAYNDRHLSCESIYAYGARVGCWRLLELFEQFNIPLTFFATGLALERNIDFSEALSESGHEVAGHGYRWINYRNIPLEIEKAHFKKTLSIIQSLIKRPALGWYTGRKSKNTRNICQDFGLTYDCETYDDDLPFWLSVNQQPHLVIPYNLVDNDFRYSTPMGFCNPKQFLDQLIFTFNGLYREAQRHPQLMTIGLHPRLSGRAGRAEALYQFLLHTQKYEGIWYSRRQDIAEYWQQNHPMR